MDDTTSRRLGTALAAAAILVQAPRLVLTILAADRLPVAEQAEQTLLGMAAMGTAAAVTFGGMYIAHAALTAPRWRLPLGFVCLLVLTALAGLVAPAIAARLAGQELHEVVSSTSLRAGWAVLAVLTSGLTAAGCMLAAAASSQRVITRYLRIAEVVSRTGISRSTIYELMDRGEFPMARRLTPRIVGWDDSEVDAWMAARETVPFKPRGRG